MIRNPLVRALLEELCGDPPRCSEERSCQRIPLGSLERCRSYRSTGLLFFSFFSFSNLTRQRKLIRKRLLTLPHLVRMEERTKTGLGGRLDARLHGQISPTTIMKLNRPPAHRQRERERERERKRGMALCMTN